MRPASLAWVLVTAPAAKVRELAVLVCALAVIKIVAELKDFIALLKCTWEFFARLFVAALAPLASVSRPRSITNGLETLLTTAFA